MKTTITKVKIVFDGIYEWGVGFTSDYRYRKWNLFWSMASSIFWNSFMKQENGQTSYYLVTTYGGTYIHPMDFTIVLTRPSKGALNELYELCDKCAKECDATMTMWVTTTEVEMPRYTKWNENAY